MEVRLSADTSGKLGRGGPGGRPVNRWARLSSLGSLVRKKRQEAIPWCPPRGVSRSVLYSKRLYPIPPRTTLSFRRQFRTSLVLPLEIIFNSTPKSSTQRTKTNQNACLKKKKIRARSKKKNAKNYDSYWLNLVISRVCVRVKKALWALAGNSISTLRVLILLLVRYWSRD